MTIIDENIDLNLGIIYRFKDHTCYISSLTNLDSDYLQDYEAKRIADKMVNLGLIDRENERIDITGFGIEVSEIGGWKKYKKLKTKQEQEQFAFAEERESLKTKNLVLMNEKMEYENMKREQEEKIKILTVENLKLQNIHLYYKIGYSLLGFIVAAGFFWISSLV